MAEKYYLQWTANTGESCRLSLQDSLWSYDATQRTSEGKSPVIREHATDGEDVLGVFRACTLTVNLVDTGDEGIEEFSSGDAYRWKAVLEVDSVTKFEGYYVPDDMTQAVIYEPNSLQLTFTDGLGLLKNFSLNETTLDTDGDKYSLLEIINACLQKTGLTLPLRVFGNIYDTAMTPRYTTNTADPFFQAEQKIKTYLSTNQDTDEWEDCYTVIEKILRDWNATIFQEDGYWNIVRVPELNEGSPDGTSYDENLYSPALIQAIFADVEVGQTKTIKPVNRSQIKQLIRPASKVVNTYDYKVIRLLINTNLQRLGAFISSTVDGDFTYTDYQLDVWENVGGCDAVIRVVADTATEKEIERYLIWSWNQSQTFGVYSNEFEVSEGDRFDFGFDLRAETESNFASAQSMGLWFKGVSTQEYVMVPQPFAQDERVWIPTNVVIPSPVGDYDNPSTTYGRQWQGREDIREPHRLTVQEGNVLYQSRFPEDGSMRIAIFGFNDSANRLADKDSLVSDMSFEYLLYISNSIKVRGERHEATQAIDYNKLIERTIYTSDSPKANVAGCMFVGAEKTTAWTSDLFPFAKLSILDEMVLRGVSRYKIEGDLRGLLNMTDILAPDFLSGRRFFCNRLVVDYGTGVCNLFADEVSGPDDLTRGDFDYTFKFIYE